MSSSPLIHKLSTSTIKPSSNTRKLCPLNPWDLARLNGHYIQKGLLFSNPTPPPNPTDIADRLKTSLVIALDHFYPLVGRFVTEKSYDQHGKVTGFTMAIDCNSQGAEFIHAIAENLTVADVCAESRCVPSFVHSLFALDGIINYDGHTEPLLAVQFTVLADGFFVGCSFNHCVADGTSYWNFFNAWASIARGEVTDHLTRPPVHERWFMDGNSSGSILMPFESQDELIERFTPATFQEKFFHFSAQSIAELKAKSNDANGSRNSTISSLQSVISLVWRAIVRARKQPDEQETSAKFTIEARSRLPLSPNYFGNAINVITPSTTVGELLGGGLEWGAKLAHEAVSEHTADVIRESYIAWLTKPKFSKMSLYEDGRSVMLSSSPRFKMYECDFGYGKAVAVRSGIGAKFDGKVWLYPGREGGGSMDLEICLAPEHMKELERDEEFASAVTLG